MNTLRRWTLLSAAMLLAAPRASSQALGQLLYATRAGRAISLKVTGVAPLELRPETGDAEQFRSFILAHAGREERIAKGAYPLPEKAPIGWRVHGPRGDVLLKSPSATYWRYSAGQVIPVRFLFKGQAWALLSADIPPRRLVAGEAR